MYRHSKLNHEFAGGALPKLCFFICSTPRSGSSVLCEALLNTGLAGPPTEYFDANLMNRFRNRWKTESDDEYFDALVRKKTSDNGVFGCKVHVRQFQTSVLAPEKLHLFTNPKYVFITRDDKIRQAVSYWKATQNQEWSSTQKSRQTNLIYSFDEIEKLRQRIVEDERRWMKVFDVYKISPFVLHYEEFENNILHAVQRILKFLKIDFSDDLPVNKLTLEKQFDETSRQWCERFASERNS